MNQNRPQHCGYNLIEITVSTAIMIAALGSIYAATRTAMTTAEFTKASATLNQKVHRTSHRIADYLVETRADTIVVLPDPNLGSSSITFRRPDSYVDGAIQWGATSTIEFRYAPGEFDDGIDNNGNGLIDDGEIYVISDVGSADERETLLATRISEFQPGETMNGLDDNGNGLIDEGGLSFALDESTLTVRVAIEANTRAGNPLVRQAETTVTFRN